jgi:pimeloyl-ACP methyl ester carboxylesterase
MTTIVTIPGIMSDARTWSTIADALKCEGTTVHVADTSSDMTLEGMAARALSEAHGELIVLAHSMGGRVAMEMGRQAPKRIRAMVLASTNAEGPDVHEAPQREARIAEANADMIAYARGWIPKVISAASMRNADLVSRIQEVVEDCPPEVHERQNRALLVRPDATTYLGTFEFPVLLITGSEDRLSTAVAHDAIAGMLQDAESVIIEDAGHLLPFEQPRRVSETIKEWLSRKALHRREYSTRKIR